MRQMLRLALVGCGDFGKYLGRYFLEVADIVALCDLDMGRVEETANALNLGVPHYTDYRAMFAAGGLDAVAVTAANFAHAEITIAAVNTGTTRTWRTPSIIPVRFNFPMAVSYASITMTVTTGTAM